jgi:hypothetical protein
MAVKKVDVSE